MLVSVGKPTRRQGSVVLFLALLSLLAPVMAAGMTALYVDISPQIPGIFDPHANLRAAKPLALAASDSIDGFAHEGMIFRVEVEYDTASGFYIAERDLLNRPYGSPRVFSRERYRNYRLEKERQEMLQAKFRSTIYTPVEKGGSGAIEIQVPFRIRNRTFRRIFGGDRVGLRVTGNINIDGGLRRETSDQVVTTQSDQTNYNFKIDQTQRFNIVGKVGDKVSVQIDQDSERLFDFENNVKLTYEGYEDEIIQSIEAGNVTLDLTGTQLATMSAKNQGLFGFKTEATVGPLNVTTIASLQNGEKNKITYTGGSEEQTYTFEDVDLVRDQYFFLDNMYRDNYPIYSGNFIHQLPARTISDIEVYRSVNPRLAEVYYEGVAVYDEELDNFVPAIPVGVTGTAYASAVSEIYEQYSAEDNLENAEIAYFEALDPDNDYDVDPNLGYIRLKSSAQDDQIIAVAYILNDGTRIGSFSPAGSQVVLKLLKPATPNPDDPTWDLSWRHVYWTGTMDISFSNFGLTMYRGTQKKETNEAGTNLLEVFGLDHFSSDGSSNPDGIIDSLFINKKYGELHFPDLRPFDPEGYTLDGTPVIAVLDSGLSNPNLYNLLPDGDVSIESYFNFESEYVSASGDINLGINVLEGSEEVYLNGRQLKKDTDYTIDYVSGRIVILDESAYSENARLEINYESGEVFQLDQQTMFGVRLQYDMWEDSFIGATLLYFNEKPLEKRVKVGNEPLRNTVWDLNTRIRFRPYFMTQAMNALPLIETDAPSEFTLEGEIAQVFPNPNSLNNESTGDNDGVAYIDDFESSRSTTPLGIARKGWYPASHPVRLPKGESPSSVDDTLDVRGRFYWYNPYQAVSIKDIWPNRELNSQVANTTTIMIMDYDPTVNNFRSSQFDSTRTWNGIMKRLSGGYANQSRTRYIEVWMNWSGGGSDAALYIDMGQISEDVIPNKELDTEDISTAGAATGNGVLDEGEDVGLDGMNKGDPPWRQVSLPGDPAWTVENQNYDFTSTQYDWWDLDDDGIHDPNEPFSSDDWSYVSGSSDVDQINGTQGNANDEGRYPDTEDLDNNSQADRENNFFRYRFKFNDTADQVKYIRGGQENEKGWRLVRIPIEDVFDAVNAPDLTEIEYVRFWIGNASSNLEIGIAQIELVGNEWLQDPVIDPVSGDTLVYLTGATINTYDNAEDYDPPPGVEGEVDPITDLRQQEQSLVVQVLNLPSATEGQLIKTLYNAQDLREYRYLKMFVHGGGRNVEKMYDKDLEMFLRFGSGLDGSANESYYEYTQKLNPGWSGNDITIDLDHLTTLKKTASDAGDNTAYEVLPNGDVIRVVGTPTLGSVKVYSIGVRNVGKPISEDEEIEMWVDELRVSEVRKESGMAMRSSFNAAFADVLRVSGSMNQRDAEFHSVEARTGSSSSTLNGEMSATLNLEKMLAPEWKVDLPLTGHVQSKLEVPKYTKSNGDIRLTSLDEGQDISIWQEYGRLAFDKTHFEDRPLMDEEGVPVINPNTGEPYQDPELWGIDTLFTTNQSYDWSLSYNKGAGSTNPLIHYTLDAISWKIGHAQTYSSGLNKQYSKSFTNNGNLTYVLNFPVTSLGIFGWTEGVPVVNKLSGNKLNLWPKKLNTNVTVNQSRTSSKTRNAAERASYSMSATRTFSTGISPFRPLNFDYSYKIKSEQVKEDSTLQSIIYSDRPASDQTLYWEPGTSYKTIYDSTLNVLRTDPLFSSMGNQIANQAEDMLLAGESYDAIVEFMFEEIDANFPNADIKRPWIAQEAGDVEFDKRFTKFLGMNFADTQKNQTISASYNPNLISWLGTSSNYRTVYNWNWSGMNYMSRSVSSSNTIGGSIDLKLQQLLGGGSKAGGRDASRRGGRNGGFEPPASKGPRSRATKPPEGEQAEGAEESEQKQPATPKELFKLLYASLKKLENIGLDYSQSLNYSNPTVEEGTADLLYQLGLSGDPGLGLVEGGTSVRQVSRTDAYRLSSGVGWSPRVTSTASYNYSWSRTHSSAISGTITRSGFYYYDTANQSLVWMDIPNYTFRWTGLEQIPLIGMVAQSVSFDHGYQGSISEQWTEAAEAGTGVIKRSTRSKAYNKAFSPLGSFTITWKYGISSSIKYNWSQSLSETVANSQLNRTTSESVNITGSYTKKSGFRIPLPIWPFKNRRFENETTFSLAYERSVSMKEVKYEGEDFESSSNSDSWSVTPSINYKFSNNVTGSARYKYGITKTVTNTRRYQEFGINVNISIRG